MSVTFVFVGRITQEKGFDRILQSVYSLLQEQLTDFVIHVYGRGDMEQRLRDHLGYGTYLIYHGHVPKEQFLQERKSYQYTLMPSKFLESFGLVALDSLAVGVPVIGMKKGGLAPFIFDELAVESYETFFSCMKRLITGFDAAIRKAQSDKALQIAGEYTVQQRRKQFSNLSGLSKGATVLLVSDYAVDIGGIENYLLHTQRLLDQQ